VIIARQARAYSVQRHKRCAITIAKRHKGRGASSIKRQTNIYKLIGIRIFCGRARFLRRGMVVIKGSILPSCRGAFIIIMSSWWSAWSSVPLFL
jgi:hypothetical protein